MKKTLKLTDRSLNKILIREAVLTKVAQSCIITSTPARAVCCGQPHTTHSTALHMCTRITSPTTWVKAVMKGRMSCASLTFQIANTYGLKESFQRQKKKTQTCAIKLETPKFDALTMAAETSISFHTQSSLLFHASHSEYLPPITSAIL